MDKKTEAMEMLAATSRTFLIPIKMLPSKLQQAVTAAYLCMRAIDEIEDHPTLPPEHKAALLQQISVLLRKPHDPSAFHTLFEPYIDDLPEVTLRLHDWILHSPPNIVSEILQSTATMSQGMADWVLKGWNIKDEHDLDDYTYYVAGLVGMMLSHIWRWYDGLETDSDLAISFGRGLQTVNILRNRLEDLERGVDYYPAGWTDQEMFSYARKNLAKADEYIQAIPRGPIYHFCKIPLVLAHGTLKALSEGKSKLSRGAVADLVSRVVDV